MRRLLINPIMGYPDPLGRPTWIRAAPVIPWRDTEGIVQKIVVLPSTESITGLKADIGIESGIPFRVFEKFLFAEIGAKIILPVFVRSLKLCRFLIDECQTDRIGCHTCTPLSW
jgi:hypothetical protein